MAGLIRLPNDAVRRVRTLTLPKIAPDPLKLGAIKADYLQQYFRRRSQSGGRP